MSKLIGTAAQIPEMLRVNAKDRYDTQSWGAQSHPAQYSLVQITLTDGEVVEFTAKVGPSIAQHLTRTMRENGYLTLWNDVDTLSIRADLVKMFTLRELTK